MKERRRLGDENWKILYNTLLELSEKIIKIKITHGKKTNNVEQDVSEDEMAEIMVKEEWLIRFNEVEYV